MSPRDASCSTVLGTLLLLLGCGLPGCSGNHGGGRNSGENAATQLTQLKCGDATYRIIPDRIDVEVSGACDRVTKSHEAEQSSRAARARFTCQDSKGHVVESVLVPNALLEDYNRSCQQYLAADQAFENGTADRSIHFAALRAFQDETNQLTRQSVDDANTTWRQNRADRALLNKLVKDRGGSIEIAD
jgi:hypothetical protein